jgi:hypothetical protein
MDVALTLDAPALRLLASLLWARDPGNPLTVRVSALAEAATSHDREHPGDPGVWRLHGPDAEPSPILRIETISGLVSLDVRTVVGIVARWPGRLVTFASSVNGEMVRLEFERADEADAALDRIHAARVQHDDAKAEDRRTERLAEAVARGVAEELRAVLPSLGRGLVGAVDRAAAAALVRAVPGQEPQP